MATSAQPAVLPPFPESFVQMRARSVDAFSALAETNQRVLAKLMELSSAAVRESLICKDLERFQADFFRTLNSVVEPWVRAGVGSPWLWPSGLIVVEMQGRKTGRLISLPLLATLVGDLVLVSTVRGRSQWVRNMAATPDVRYWMNGRAHGATAFVVAPGLDQARSDSLSPIGRGLASNLLPLAQALGMAFAILSPASGARST
jgi:F420H(2)-dependent quinone reductase